ncbi:MAG: DUF2177 family protein [Pseudorhizobium sp.]
MLTPFVAYVSTAIVFLGIDAIWLGRVATSLYRGWIGDLMLEQPNFAAAAAFYLVYAAGIVYFAVMPAINGGGWTHAALAGAILGFIAYGTYDMTNLATLKNWPVMMTVVDLAWGTLLTSAAATAGYLITQRLV